MATLTSSQLARMRRSTRTEWTTPIDFGKSTINAVFQAIEDEFERPFGVPGPGFKLSAAAAITVAATPKVFTNSEKKKIARAYLGEKFRLEAN